MSAEPHATVIPHLPIFITAPGQTDVLFNVMAVLLVVLLLLAGNFYLRLHALPEHMAHGTSKVQLQLVAVLSLIALFTHSHLYWILALLLAMVQLPDFSTPMSSMARSLEKLANPRGRPDETSEASLVSDADPK